MQPVKTTMAAVKGATPPIFSTMLIAIGVVTDFGARERMHVCSLKEVTGSADPATRV